ncbi:hypothetical protein BD626DRAFT_568472 [Schizophyllum amplum]|uniref:Uncharacterized protein n=1 Tax=Schizophyllum amplum TaxID=97359 RepID=A0A550CGC6_9AGAR|nr:hypothetical protein BD626DRAFT_568472 [Auriculariopsis ampla]
MLQGLHSVVNLLFNGSPSAPSHASDKTTAKMTGPYRYIPYVVQDRTCSYSPSQFVTIVQENVHFDPQHNRTLRDCRVNEVIYLRREGAFDNGPHEVVVVRYSHSVFGKNGAVLGTDSRVGRFERLQHESMRQNNGVADLDSVCVVEVIEDVSHDYERVASFTPAQSTLSIVDCLVAACVISERAARHTTAPYMSMWYTHTLFESLRRLMGWPSLTEGTAHKRAGMWAELQVVTPQGRLVQSMDIVKKLRQQQSNILGYGESVAAIREAVRHDLHQDIQEGSAAQLEEVQTAIETARAGTWRAIDEAADYAYERVHREEILKAQLARSTEEVNKLRAQLAQLRNDS